MTAAGRAARNLLIAAAVAAAGVGVLSLSWKMIGGSPLSLHGWIAMTLGVSGTIALAWVLMTLAFRSDREGWDDQVDNSLDPGREDPDRD